MTTTHVTCVATPHRLTSCEVLTCISYGTTVTRAGARMSSVIVLFMSNSHTAASHCTYHCEFHEAILAPNNAPGVADDLVAIDGM